VNPRRPLRIGSAALALILSSPLLAAPPQGQPQTATPAAEAGIRETLQQYSAALESLDANAVKRVQPSIPVESLTRAFNDMRELEVAIDQIRVLSRDATTARVSCRVTQTLTPRVGTRQTTTVTRVMRLRRDSDTWVIDAFER
jgi:hypothetical protein